MVDPTNPAKPAASSPDAKSGEKKSAQPKTYEAHPLANIFPMLEDESVGFKALVEDIRANGQGDYARAGRLGVAAGLSPDLISVVIGNLLIEIGQREKALSFLSGSQLIREAEAELKAEREPSASFAEERK
jgi:hypothetical protein